LIVHWALGLEKAKGIPSIVVVTPQIPEFCKFLLRIEQKQLKNVNTLVDE